MNEFRQILLTGATGQLGSHLAKSGLFPNLLTPSRKALDICNPRSVEAYFKKHSFDAVIHTAAMARMREAEEDPIAAIETNLLGTARLAEETLKKDKKRKHPIRFVHISTDGVYESIKGPYKENGPTIPYNTYGWTKLGAETCVHPLKNFCIIRTRFHDPRHAPFKTYAADSYSSSIAVDALCKAIHTMLHHSFVGTINIGGKKQSDYSLYKKIDPSIKPCRLNDILKTIPFKLSRDASMDCRLWERIKKCS